MLISLLQTEENRKLQREQKAQQNRNIQEEDENQVRIRLCLSCGHFPTYYLPKISAALPGEPARRRPGEGEGRQA